MILWEPEGPAAVSFLWMTGWRPALLLLEKHEETIGNIGSEQICTVAELADTMAAVVGFREKLFGTLETRWSKKKISTLK